MPDPYQEALAFLYGRLNYERTGMPRIPAELRLGRMRRFLRRLGDPQDSLRIVHVAGTKGKGSIAAMIASAMTASGVTTGLFSSPHLHRLEERFRVDGIEATPDDLISLVEAIRPAVEHFDSDVTHHRHRGPTFFEITTAMGLIHFARKNTGLVLLEVGLGGRLDSTNCVRPEVAVITSISLDHTKQLGTTLGAIAVEKAGIVKRGCLAVSGVGPGEARSAIRRVAESRKARLIEIELDFSCECQLPDRPLLKPTPCRVRVVTSRRSWGPIELPLLGPHQARNAAVALATIDVLADRGFAVEPEDVERGWASLDWPARVEVFGSSPWIVIDGAHNVASAEALAETLRTCFPEATRTLVFGTTRDKDLPGQLRALLPLFDLVIATRYVENPRSVPPEEVAALVTNHRVATAPSPRAALEMARERTLDGGMIVVTGSLFLAAETRACLQEEQDY